MRHLLLGAYACICLACLTWPVYTEFGAHIEPFVLGLPLSFAWVIGWALVTFAVMVCYHLADQRAERQAIERRRERSEPASDSSDADRAAGAT